MMNTYLILFFVLFVISLVLTYAVKQAAIKKSLVDIPNDRSSHTVPVHRGGGIAIAVTWFAGLGYLYSAKLIESDLFYALTAGVVIALVSYLDDLYNFLDGIDGYAGSEVVFLGVAGYLLFGDAQFVALVASVLGFLVWNWHKAKIFMGDVGSTLLGYTIAIFAIHYQNHDTSILVWLILFGLFWFDATLTLYRRYKNKEQLSQAHKKHAYQRLTQADWSHSRVVLYSLLINLVLFFFAWITMKYSSFGLVWFGVSMIFLYGIVWYIDKKKTLSI